jgi:hypothetical protein
MKSGQRVTAWSWRAVSRIGNKLSLLQPDILLRYMVQGLAMGGKKA